MDEPVNALAANLRRLRAERGLSTVALARDSGVARATLAQIEAGRGNPTLETLYALANTLEVALADVIAPAVAADVEVVRAADGPRVTGAAVRARLVARLSGRASVELYELSLRPGRRQVSAAHPIGRRRAPARPCRAARASGPRARRSSSAPATTPATPPASRTSTRRSSPA